MVDMNMVDIEILGLVQSEFERKNNVNNLVHLVSLSHTMKRKVKLKYFFILNSTTTFTVTDNSNRLQGPAHQTVRSRRWREGRP